MGPSVGTAKGAPLNRLTQSYVVVAISGTATIVAAVVAFVMLVSLQTIQEWPISGLGFGSGDSGGVTRATELNAPASPARAHAATPSSLSGATRAPADAATPGVPGGRAAHRGQADLEGGSAIAGRGDRSRGVSTGAPTATAPSLDSDSPSDAGSAAPVEPTGAGNGSGASAGSHSASGVRGAPPTEAAGTPTGQDRSHGSAAGENAGRGHSSHGGGAKSTGPSKTAGPSKSASGKANGPPISKPSPSSGGQAPGPPTSKPAPPAAASANAAPGLGAGR
jgi:hypothetical protein